MPKATADLRAERLKRELERTGEDPAAHVDSQFRRAESARSPLARDWYLNSAFIKGNQWYAVDGDARDVRPIPRRSWRKQVTVNGLMSIERAVVAKLTAQRPVPAVLPATNTDEDRSLARACERLIEYQFRKIGWDVELTKWASNLFVTGSAWWKVYWNPEGGPTQELDEVVASEFGISEDDRVQKEGDLVVESVSPFEIFVDPGAKKFEEARWLIHVHFMHVDEVYARWGVEVQGQRASSFGYDWIGVAGTVRDDAADMSMLKEYWERPSKDFPRGRRAVVAGDKVLEYEVPKEGEEPIDKLPFVYCPFYPNNDGMYGVTPMNYARELQMNINQIFSLIVEQMALSAHGKWLIPKGSGVTKITSAPGEKIEYNPTHGPPQWVRGDPVSPNMMNLAGMFREAQQYVLGIHEASMGMSAGASQSGRSVLFQAEQDNTKLGPTLKCMRQALRILGRMMLETWRDNADFPLNYRILGENAVSEAKSLDAANIRFEDVEFQIESSLPQNREARRQLVLQLAQMGLITREKALKMLEFGDIGDIYDGMDRDKERARNENDMIYDGGQVSASQHEDHASHLEAHIDSMKENKFYGAPENIKQAFMLHIQQHAAMLQGGTPPGPGPQGPGGPQGPQGPPGPEMGGMTPDVPAFQAGGAGLPTPEPSMEEIQGLEEIAGRTI